MIGNFLSQCFCVITGKVSDISCRKHPVLKCLIQETHCTQHKIANKAKNLQASVCRKKCLWIPNVNMRI